MYTHVAIQKYALLSVCEVTYQSMKKYYHIACHKELIGVSLLGLQREGRGRQCDSEPSCSVSSGCTMLMRAKFKYFLCNTREIA